MAQARLQTKEKARSRLQVGPFACPKCSHLTQALEGVWASTASAVVTVQSSQAPTPLLLASAKFM